MKVKDIQPKAAEHVTEEVIAAWKAAYPRGVWEMKVYEDEDDEGSPLRTGYVRKPTRQELSASMTYREDPLKMGEDLLRVCWLGGDEELITDDDYFQGALTQFQELMKIRAGEIKKL